MTDEVFETDLSDDEPLVGKNNLDLANFEKNLRRAAVAQDMRKLKSWLRRASHLRQCGFKTHAIHDAARTGHKEVIELLIRFGCDMEFHLHDSTALYLAVSNNREDIVGLLVKTKIEIDAQKPTTLNSALHVAARRELTGGLKILLDGGAAVNIQNKIEETPLHLAANNGNGRCVKMLLNHGARVSIKDRNKHSALHIAAAKGHVHIVELLLDYGAEVDAYDVFGKPPLTPLEFAIHRSQPSVVRCLLQRGANVNFQKS